MGVWDVRAAAAMAAKMACSIFGSKIPKFKLCLMYMKGL